MPILKANTDFMLWDDQRRHGRNEVRAQPSQSNESCLRCNDRQQQDHPNVAHRIYTSESYSVALNLFELHLVTQTSVWELY